MSAPRARGARDDVRGDAVRLHLLEELLGAVHAPGACVRVDHRVEAHLWAKRAEAPILGTVYWCFKGLQTVCVVSKGVQVVWNPKTVTLPPALVQWLADCKSKSYSPFRYASWRFRDFPRP